MKLFNFSLLMLLLAGNSTAQSYIKFGKHIYSISCGDKINRYYPKDNHHDYYYHQCSMSTIYSKVIPVPKYYSLNDYAIVNPAPPYSTISIHDGVVVDSVIRLDNLSESINLDKDSLVNIEFKLFINDTQYEIVGFNLWVIGEKTIFVKATDQPNNDILRDIRRFLNTEIKNISKLVLTDVYYRENDEINCHINFEIECTLE